MRGISRFLNKKAVLVALLLASPGISFAWHGCRGHYGSFASQQGTLTGATGYESGRGACCIKDYSQILDGTPITISGLVAEVGVMGQGVSIDTGNGIVKVYGLGPYSYWALKGIARPQVGENILVEGYEVEFSDGTKKIIATKITIGENTIELRDPSTGMPLWRGGIMRGYGFRK